MKRSGWLLVAMCLGWCDVAISTDSSGRTITEKVVGTLGSDYIERFVLSPDGRRFAYTANIGDLGGSGPEKQFVVVDGLRGPKFNHIATGDVQIGPLIFSADSSRLAYAAVNGGHMSPVVDGRAIGRYPVVKMSRHPFSTDGTHFAFFAGNDSYTGAAVVDGRKGKEYRGISKPLMSPDGKHVAYTVRRLDEPRQDFVVLDGKEGQRYRRIHQPDDGAGAGSLVFSPLGGRLAFAADKDAKTVVAVVDGKESKHYQRIEYGPMFSPDGRRYLFVARPSSAGPSILEVDGIEIARYDGVIVPKFCPDSKTLAYVTSSGVDGRDSTVYFNGKKVASYMGSRVLGLELTCTADGKRIAYQVFHGDEQNVVVDGKPGNRYRHVNDLTFSPDNNRFGYIATRGEQQFVVVDGVEGKPYDLVHDLVFSPDSRSVAYTAYTKKYKRWFVVVNEHEGMPADNIFSRGMRVGTHVARLEYGSLRFDAPDRLRYLAVRGGKIVSVQEKLNLAQLAAAVQAQAVAGQAATQCPLHNEEHAVLGADDVNLRETPDISGKVLRVLSRDTPLRILGRDDHCSTIGDKFGRWVEVDVPRAPAISGWLFEPYLNYNAPPLSPALFERTIGACHLASSRPDDRQSAVNSLSPVGTVWGYFRKKEKLILKEDKYHAAKMTLLEPPKHGEMGMGKSDAAYFANLPNFEGTDQATVLVEIGGYRVKVKYFIKVMLGVGGGSDQGTPYDDERNCPNGKMWKISLSLEELSPYNVKPLEPTR